MTCNLSVKTTNNVLYIFSRYNVSLSAAAGLYAKYKQLHNGFGTLEELCQVDIDLSEF